MGNEFNEFVFVFFLHVPGGNVWDVFMVWFIQLFLNLSPWLLYIEFPDFGESTTLPLVHNSWEKIVSPQWEKEREGICFWRTWFISQVIACDSSLNFKDERFCSLRLGGQTTTRSALNFLSLPDSEQRERENLRQKRVKYRRVVYRKFQHQKVHNI